LFNVKKELELLTEHEGLVIGLFEKTEKFTGILALLDEAFNGQLRELVKSGDISAKFKSISKVHSLGKIGPKRIWFVGLGKEKECTFEKVKKAFGRLFKEVKASKLEETAVYLDSFTAELVDGLDAAHAMSEAVALSTYQFEGYKQKSNQPEKKLEDVTIYCNNFDEEEIQASLTVGYAFGKGTNSARTLVNIPGNLLTARRAKRDQPKPNWCQSLVALPVRGRGTRERGHQTSHGVTNLMSSGSVLERRATVGKSPVHERHSDSAWSSQVAPGP
jgi:leucyl aminopeptidase